MFTPQEVSEKVFPKASFGGYNMSTVDQFLDALTEDYTSLYKDNAALKAKLKVLAEKIEEYRATEDAMRSTLLTAQKMASQLVQQAHEERDQILRDARSESEKLVHLYTSQATESQQRLLLGQQKLAEFIQRSQRLCQEQADFLKTLPDLDLLPPQRAEETPIEQDIQKACAAEETSAPQVEVAPEAPVAAPEEPPVEAPKAEAAVPAAEPPFFADFNMDELKFGRNYEN